MTEEKLFFVGRRKKNKGFLLVFVDKKERKSIAHECGFVRSPIVGFAREREICTESETPGEEEKEEGEPTSIGVSEWL